MVHMAKKLTKRGVCLLVAQRAREIRLAASYEDSPLDTIIMQLMRLECDMQNEVLNHGAAEDADIPVDDPLLPFTDADAFKPKGIPEAELVE